MVQSNVGNFNFSRRLNAGLALERDDFDRYMFDFGVSFQELFVVLRRAGMVGRNG
jgi:hypothetical protein